MIKGTKIKNHQQKQIRGEWKTEASTQTIEH